jgi:hypothetical protein
MHADFLMVGRRPTKIGSGGMSYDRSWGDENHQKTCF